MEQISAADARSDWIRELKFRRWDRARIRLAMFDYDPSLHGLISYSPAPAWKCIAKNDFADRDAYEKVKRSLLLQGERFSKLGVSSRSSSTKIPVAYVELNPAELPRDDVFEAIASVMASVHPQIATQEQIVRCAFIAHLPQEIARQIGTPSSCVHPERATPGLYRQTGRKFSKARFDLGFGHAKDDDAITGVIEIKAGNISFDSLKRRNEIITTEFEDVDGVVSKRREELSVDIDKMLDPGLPPNAFRVSWIALGRRGSSTADEIKTHACILLNHCAAKLRLPPPAIQIETERRWLTVSWPSQGVHLHLAWYRPTAEYPFRFEPVWTED